MIILINIFIFSVFFLQAQFMNLTVTLCIHVTSVSLISSASLYSQTPYSLPSPANPVLNSCKISLDV